MRMRRMGLAVPLQQLLLLLLLVGEAGGQLVRVVVFEVRGLVALLLIWRKQGVARLVGEQVLVQARWLR